MQSVVKFVLGSPRWWLHRCWPRRCMSIQILSPSCICWRSLPPVHAGRNDVGSSAPCCWACIPSRFAVGSGTQICRTSCRCHVALHDLHWLDPIQKRPCRSSPCWKLWCAAVRADTPLWSGNRAPLLCRSSVTTLASCCHLGSSSCYHCWHTCCSPPVWTTQRDVESLPRLSDWSVERPRLRWVLGPQCWPWTCCQTPSCPQGCRPRCSVLHLLPHGSCWSPQVWRTWWPSQSCWRSRRYCSPSCWSDKAAVNIICCQQNVDIIKKVCETKNMLNSETVETLCSKSIMLSKTNMLPYTSTIM